MFQYSDIDMFVGSSDLSTMTVVYVGSLGPNIKSVTCLLDLPMPVLIR